MRWRSSFGAFGARPMTGFIVLSQDMTLVKSSAIEFAHSGSMRKIPVKTDTYAINKGVAFATVPAPVSPGAEIPLTPDGPNGRPESHTGGASAERFSATSGDHARVGILVEQLRDERFEIDGRLLRHDLVNNAPAFADRSTR